MSETTQQYSPATLALFTLLGIIIETFIINNKTLDALICEGKIELDLI